MGLVLLSVLIGAPARAQTRVKPGFNLFSPEQDVEIGKRSADEAEKKLPILDDSTVMRFVADMGRSLADQAPGHKFPYEFKVVNATDLNAFALPGGMIYLNRGVLEAARNDGEVAGVLAHEIAHVALRHGTHNASRAYLTQAGLGILGGILGGKVSKNTAQVIDVVGGFGLNALFLKYSRNAETEADVVGSQILARAGYSPQDMINFFRTLDGASKNDRRKTANWLSSHPAPQRRIERIEQESRLIATRPTRTGTSPSFAALNAELRGMPRAPTTDPNMKTSAAVSGPSTRGAPSPTARPVPIPLEIEAPSSEFRTYSSKRGLYQVRYPLNWNVHEQESLGVTLAPAGGAREAGDEIEILYGAVLNHYEPFGDDSPRRRSPRRASIEAATVDLAGQVTRSAPHLRRVSGSERRLRLAGGTGLGMVLRGVNPRTRVHERVTIVTRQLSDDHIVYLLFITPDADAKRYEGVLNTMVASLRVSETKPH